MAPGINRRYLDLAGLLVSVAAIVFVVARFIAIRQDLGAISLSGGLVAVLILLAALYGAANLALAAAWRCLLQHLGTNRPLGWCIGVYGRSQLAKYVPGNVFQFAGRQVIGMADGVPAATLAKSTVYEIGTIAATGCLFLPLFAGGMLHPPGPLICAIFFVLFALGLDAIVARWLSAAMAKAVRRQLLFLLAAAITFTGVVAIVEPSTELGPARAASVAGAYVIAWLAGMLTPGAPAGLGIRESVLYGVLGPTFGPAEILLAAAVGRLVTTGGDLLFYAGAHYFSRTTVD